MRRPAMEAALLAACLALAATPATAAPADVTFELAAANEKGQWVWKSGGGHTNPRLEAPTGAILHIIACGGGSDIPHNLRVEGAETSPMFDGDDCVTYEYTMPDKRSITYLCTLHPTTMTGTLSLPGAVDDEESTSKSLPAPGAALLVLALIGAALIARRR